jgi:hypothetical protein
VAAGQKSVCELRNRGSQDGPKNCNFIEKKVSNINCTIVKKCILTILFASLLFYNKRERTAVAAGQKSVCELRYRGSRDSPEKSNLIEKRVSEKTEKSSTRNCFSLVFFVSLHLCNKHERAAEEGKRKSVGELRYHRSRVGPGNGNKIEKMVSVRTVTLQKGD